MLQSSVRYRVGPFRTTPELDPRTACPTSYEEGVSRYCAEIVRGYDMLDWNFLAEECERCYHADEEANVGPYRLYDVELLFRVPHYFVGFRQVEVLDANDLRLKHVY